MFIETEYRAELAVVRDAIKNAIATVTRPTAAKLAKATYEALKKLAVEKFGQRETEVRLYKPGEPRYFDARTPQWTVTWEAGPFEWAIGASMLYPQVVEPYFSFDLCFYPGEDAELEGEPA